jgi:hypothetical protein
MSLILLIKGIKNSHIIRRKRNSSCIAVCDRRLRWYTSNLFIVRSLFHQAGYTYSPLLVQKNQSRDKKRESNIFFMSLANDSTVVSYQFGHFFIGFSGFKTAFTLTV